jgi:hypothetical protein
MICTDGRQRPRGSLVRVQVSRSKLMSLPDAVKRAFVENAQEPIEAGPATWVEPATKPALIFICTEEQWGEINRVLVEHWRLES